MGGMGLIFTRVLVRRLLGPPGLSRRMTSIVVLGLITTPNETILMGPMESTRWEVWV